jgi:hypothetical protein
MNEQRPTALSSLLTRKSELHHRVAGELLLVLGTQHVHVEPRGGCERDGGDGPALTEGQEGVT